MVSSGNGRLGLYVTRSAEHFGWFHPPQRLSRSIIELAVVRMATENRDWGYRRFDGDYAFSDLIAALAEPDFELCDVLHTERSPRTGTLFIDAMFRPVSSAERLGDLA